MHVSEGMNLWNWWVKILRRKAFINLKRDLKAKWNLQWKLEVRETKTKNLCFFAFEDLDEFAKVVMANASVEGKLLSFRGKIDQVIHSDLNFNKYIFWTVFKFIGFIADRVYMARKVAKVIGGILMMISPHDGEYKVLVIVYLTKPLVKKVDMVLEDLGPRKKSVEIDYIGLPALVCTSCMWIAHPLGLDCKNGNPSKKVNIPLVVGTRQEAKGYLELKKNKARCWKKTDQTSTEFKSLIDKEAVYRTNGKRQRMDIDRRCPENVLVKFKAKAVVIREPVWRT
ncbi:uncharacterized protein LOC113347094 [Papaver somniferum]|uniref:uncharacterized protein LOC113347094 n=1 Tax=Papaver somniferum TaxID=3469 RepID=UPI000E6FEA4A|nr:uncharacterized protein LOC113347094 [Papaver somniferum]